MSNPIELQAFVEEERPNIRKISDKKVRRAVQKALSDTALHPVFETVVQRTTRSIKVQDSEIELAVDDGEVRAGKECHRKVANRQARLLSYASGIASRRPRSNEAAVWATCRP